MGWQKRGKGHNARTGHAALMSITIQVKSWTSPQELKPADVLTMHMPKQTTRWLKFMTVTKPLSLLKSNVA